MCDTCDTEWIAVANWPQTTYGGGLGSKSDALQLMWLHNASLIHIIFTV